MNHLGDPRGCLARMGRNIVPPEDMTPTAKTAGSITFRCSCGNVETIDPKTLIEKGWACKCGKRYVPGKGDPAKKEGRRVKKRYTQKGRKAPW